MFFDHRVGSVYKKICSANYHQNFLSLIFVWSLNSLSCIIKKKSSDTCNYNEMLPLPDDKNVEKCKRLKFGSLPRMTITSNKSTDFNKRKQVICCTQTFKIFGLKNLSFFSNGVLPPFPFAWEKKFPVLYFLPKCHRIHCNSESFVKYLRCHFLGSGFGSGSHSTYVFK